MHNKHLNYNQLDDDAKVIVETKVAQMFNNNARPEAIQQVLEYVNPNVTVEKSHNKMTFVHTTPHKIMDEVKQWNLTEYWRNKANY